METFNTHNSFNQFEFENGPGNRQEPTNTFPGQS